jgi:hypothetical protein
VTDAGQPEALFTRRTTGAKRVSLAENFWASTANSERSQVANQRSTVTGAAKGFVTDEPPHLVQIRLKHSALDYLLARVRMWLDQQPVYPKTFRYSFDEPNVLVQVQFFRQAQASAFARAFGGEVLK